MPAYETEITILECVLLQRSFPKTRCRMLLSEHTDAPIHLIGGQMIQTIVIHAAQLKSYTSVNSVYINPG